MNHLKARVKLLFRLFFFRHEFSSLYCYISKRIMIDIEENHGMEIKCVENFS